MILPLVAAGLLLLAAEARRLWFPRQVARMASGMAAPLLALLVFCAGAVLLFSGVTPTVDEHLQALGFLMPSPLIAASHLAASLVGTLCLLLAQGLRRRLSAAWVLTLVLLCLGVVLSLLKGFDLSLIHILSSCRRRPWRWAASVRSPSAMPWVCRRCPAVRCAIGCMGAMASVQAMWHA